MKVLLDYILQSLPEFIELKDKMIFSFCTWKDIKNIILTDEYNYGKDLGYSGNSSTLDKEFFLSTEEDSHFFKIIYNGILLGISGVFYLKDYDNIKNTTDKFILKELFNNELIDKYKYSSQEEIFNKGAYILTFQFNSNKKKEIPLSDISFLKIFYGKLMLFLKEQGIEIICAHGKNDKITKSYTTLGRFDRYIDLVDNKKLKIILSEYPDIYNHFVIKKI